MRFSSATLYAALGFDPRSMCAPFTRCCRQTNAFHFPTRRYAIPTPLSITTALARTSPNRYENTLVPNASSITTLLLQASLSLIVPALPSYFDKGEKTCPPSRLPFGFHTETRALMQTNCARRAFQALEYCPYASLRQSGISFPIGR